MHEATLIGSWKHADRSRLAAPTDVPADANGHAG